jgi:hypothetical protein
MKKFGIALLAVAFAGLSFKLIAPEKIGFTAKDGKFMLEKLQVNMDWSLQPVMEILKSSTRTTGAEKGRYFTYDEFGLTVIEAVDKENKPTGKIVEFQVHFILPKPADINPKKVFSGTFKTEGLELSKDLDLAKVKNAMSSWTMTSDAASFTELVYKKDGMYLRFEFTGRGHNLRSVYAGRE